MDIRHIREIAQRYNPEEIERCISDQLETGKNVCLSDETSEKLIDDLSKAEAVRQFMDEGMTLADALRELARRIRRLQSSFDL